MELDTDLLGLLKGVLRAIAIGDGLIIPLHLHSPGQLKCLYSCIPQVSSGRACAEGATKSFHGAPVASLKTADV